MSRLTKAGMVLTQLTHMNRRRAAVSQIVSGLFRIFLISYGYFGVGIISGDMTGVEAAAAATIELKSSGLTLVTVDELLDDDGGVQF